ncbi:E3 ubiquitin-protein ligase RAD18-like [Saccoglossus kowalevskii]|uniref:RING-type E3 ubiquitin transferase n=1 Tax=Saccoglossus kowalevskii TaxID=10224 RepID=A0ABM0GIG6_SACKO|nr:PREDICTED: E3 ubiquitin-protein ligase RAD18-like [Saccoglossus kowalevskii]
MMSTNSEKLDLPQSLPELKAIDDSLRCEICFEYFTTALILPTCSHNYCSLCIRRFMNYKSQCPTCQTPVLEPELRNNRVLDNLVKNYLSIRPKLLRSLSDSNTPPVISSEHNDDGAIIVNNRDDKSPNAIKCAFKKVKSPKTEKSKKPSSHVESTPQPGTSTDSGKVNEDVTILKSFPSPANQSRVTSSLPKANCPVCGVTLLEKNINAHLDLCLNSDPKKSALRSSAPKRKTLPKLVYNLMSDKDLKKKLKEYNLSVQGSRQVLIKRIQEFTLLYNSQCDSENPKSAAAIAKDVEKNEKMKTQLAHKESIKQAKLVFDKGESEEEQEKKKEKYMKTHKSQYDQLINEVKKRMGTRRTKKANQAEMEDSGDKNMESATTSQSDAVPSTSSTSMETEISNSGDTPVAMDTQSSESSLATNRINESEFDIAEKCVSSKDELKFIDSISAENVNSDSDFAVDATASDGNSTRKKSKRPVGRPKKHQKSHSAVHQKEKQKLSEPEVAPEEKQCIVDEQSDEEQLSPSIFSDPMPEMKQSTSPGSSPIFGNQPQTDKRESRSPSSTPSLGFGPLESSEFGSNSETMLDDDMGKILQTLESPTTVPKRSLRKRKQESMASPDYSTGENCSSSEVETTKRKRKAPRK